VALSLPIVAQAETRIEPTPEMLSTFSPSPVSDSYVTTVTAGNTGPDITLLFTGVIVPARCVQAAIDARGDANYVYDEVREMISNADLAVGTLNASLSDLSHPTGCVETYVLVGDSRSAAAAASAGFDVMSVATNHIKNCNGASCTNYFRHAFLDTLDNLRENGIKPVGAGMNLEEALQPVVVEVQGVRFGFVSLGMIEPLAFAGKYGEGIAELNDENLVSAIDSARQVADVVIAMPHWGPEDFSDPTEEQLHFARVAVEAGADVVVSSHTTLPGHQQIDGSMCSSGWQLHLRPVLGPGTPARVILLLHFREGLHEL
jgi:poly-gamma-glutamate synthesis protein (capsule biosynthesis protein)